MVIRRNTLISVFVACWLALFTYETFRASYLSPLAGRQLPKFPLLFPPAGWIMFYHVDRSYGFAEVHALPRDGSPVVMLNPHEIFETRAVGYDNIRRNVLVGVLSRDRAPAFCRYLRRKFPAYQAFAVVYGQYPDVVDQPDRILRQLAYRCQ
jgi:hypothetical protein